MNYTTTNKLKTPNALDLVPPLDSRLSPVSLADDAVLLSNNIYDLRNLLHLTVHYCNKYQVKLVPEKSHFLAFGFPDHEINIIDSSCLISLDGKTINYSSQAVLL